MRQSSLRSLPARPDRFPLPTLVLAVWCLGVVAATAQGLIHPINNFAIFRGSWENLAAGRDLYAPSTQYKDFYKYSPAFALLFAPFAVLPNGVALLAWNALNAGLLYIALGRLLAPRDAVAARAFVFLDTFGSMQNAQSNALVAALIILTFTELERDRSLAGAIAVAAGTAIKIFPVAAGVFLVFHPRKLRFVALSVACGAALVVAPLLVVPPSGLLAQYHSWRLLEGTDALTRNFSVMQHVHLVFGVDWPNWPQQLAGVLVLLLPLVVRRERLPERRFQLLFLASLLLFCVLFNHQAESPSFVIATSGVAIWFLTVERTPSAWALLVFVFIGTTLSKSELFPAVVRRNVVDRYFLKTIPCLLVWLAIQPRLWRAGSQRGERHKLDVAPAEPRAQFG
jgi:hypothetical protein